MAMHETEDNKVFQRFKKRIAPEPHQVKTNKHHTESTQTSSSMSISQGFVLFRWCVTAERDLPCGSLLSTLPLIKISHHAPVVPKGRLSFRYSLLIKCWSDILNPSRIPRSHLFLSAHLKSSTWPPCVSPIMYVILVCVCVCVGDAPAVKQSLCGLHRSQYRLGDPGHLRVLCKL